MHSYMRAIGFSDIKDGNEIKDIIHDVFYEYDKREAVKAVSYTHLTLPTN